MKIHYTKLNTDTLAQLVKRVLSISKKEAYVIVLNHPFLINLMKTADEYLIVFDKSTYSGKGKVVAKADLLRDTLFNGMKNSLLGLTNMHGLTTQQDAADLYAIFEAHGLDLYRYSYGDESSHLDKLIEELELPENKAKIEQVHLTEAYGLMKSAQLNFELLFGEQTEANAKLRLMESASSLQNRLIEALRNYLNYVEQMNKIDTGWQDLYAELDETVKAAANSKQETKKDTSAPVTDAK